MLNQLTVGWFDLLESVGMKVKYVSTNGEPRILWIHWPLGRWQEVRRLLGTVKMTKFWIWLPQFYWKWTFCTHKKKWDMWLHCMTEYIQVENECRLFKIGAPTWFISQVCQKWSPSPQTWIKITHKVESDW